MWGDGFPLHRPEDFVQHFTGRCDIFRFLLRGIPLPARALFGRNRIGIELLHAEPPDGPVKEAGASGSPCPQCVDEQLSHP